MFCKQKILISKESGKWLPYELINGPHECKRKNGDDKDKKEITLEMVQRKLESIGIIINVDRLMNEK
jgi:hypothetical protein